MKSVFVFLLLSATTAFAQIPEGASIYSCHMSLKAGGYDSAPTYGFSVKDATLRMTALKLELNAQGELVKKDLATEVVTDVECKVQGSF